MPHNGLLSKDTELSYKSGNSYVAIPDCQSIGAIGTDIERVDVTHLKDSCHIYIKGLDDYSDLECKFIYANGASDAFRLFNSFGDATKEYQIELPDETKLQFEAQSSWKLDEINVDEALTFTVTLVISSAITIVNPA